MKQSKPTCPHCGASMKEYRHTFSKALAEGLKRLYDYNIPVNLKYLKLTRNQWDNFQKLRYWGLVTKYTDQNGNRVGGTWQITQLGIKFVEGEAKIPRIARTYRGEIVAFEGEFVSFSDKHDTYKSKLDYAEDAIIHHSL